MTRNVQSLILLAVVIFGIILVFLCGSNSTKRIIVDVDGGVDDLQALVMLLNAEHEGFVKIEAIVCVNGNTNVQHVSVNVLRLLETIKRTDIPVYVGSYNNILPNQVDIHWYGSDGFGDLHYERSVETTPKRELGIVAVKDLLLHNPKEISIVCLGPLTNIGMLLRIYKDISESIKEIYIMGGNYLGTEAEFNFKSDPEAASIVLTTAQCPIKMLTWQACSNVTTNLQWRFGIEMDNPVWNLNERAERALYSTDYTDNPNTTYISCDGILGSLFMAPHVVTNSSSHAATVDLCSTKGLVIIDDSNHHNNTEIITNVDSETFKEEYVQHFIDICKNYECLDLF